MANAYVLMRRGWDYNDEYYYPSEGGSACKAYLDKAKAEKACKAANRRAARGKDGISLGEAFGEDCSYELRMVDAEIREKMGLLDLDDELYEYRAPDNVSDEVIDKFLAQSGITFYIVQEVALDG